jgi:hypothetical protein
MACNTTQFYVRKSLSYSHKANEINEKARRRKKESTLKFFREKNEGKAFQATVGTEGV